MGSKHLKSYFEKRSSLFFFRYCQQGKYNRRKAVFRDVPISIFPRHQEWITFDSWKKACTQFQGGYIPWEVLKKAIEVLAVDENMPFLDLLKSKERMDIFQITLMARNDVQEFLSLNAKCKNYFPYCRLALGLQNSYWCCSHQKPCEKISIHRLIEIANYAICQKV